MISNTWSAENIIGIDFGMTCTGSLLHEASSYWFFRHSIPYTRWRETGVAYSMDTGWPHPKIIQHWPGKLLNELSNKVPTRLQYDEHTEHVKKWGFQCEYDEDGADVKDFFKLHLDPNYIDPSPDAPKVADARRWLRDYLRCIHTHIREILSDFFPRWTTQRTEFVFNIPTTWNNPRMISDMEAIVREAGFDFNGAEHRIRIDLTETEAAAVYASQQQFEV